ncbi:hypothetical protein OG21DRAFT_1514072 [Imleria badia]|nr:hypothetical protein OG21DRAFT_1514072 [Imleria badia]
MAASCVMYRLEKTNHPVFTPAEPWQEVRQTAAQRAFTPNTNSNFRTTLQGLTNVARSLLTEQALFISR